jgi:peptidoglycan-N-acetylglucosamine deacetylase
MIRLNSRPPARLARSEAPIASIAVRAEETGGEKNVWLTFDDGPHPFNTGCILRKLEAVNIKATFFVVGRNARNLESLVKEMFDAGHRIGNHSYTHPDFTTLTEAKIREEIERTDEVIGDYAGPEKILRPPYGHTNETVRNAAAKLGYRIILWNVDTLDWNRSYKPERWIDHGLTQIGSRKYSNVLNHDTIKTTADNLHTFINRIKQLRDVTFASPSTILQSWAAPRLPTT